MTNDAQTTALMFLFAGFAIVGAYCVVIFPILLILHGVHKMKTPLPEIQKLNGTRRWRKQ